MEELRAFLTLSEVAKRLRVSRVKVRGWVHRGELIAVNLGNGYRPGYRVSLDALDAFLKGREVQPPPKHVRRSPQPPEGGPIDPELGEKLLKKGQAVKCGNKYYRVWNGVIQFY